MNLWSWIGPCKKKKAQACFLTNPVWVSWWKVVIVGWCLCQEQHWTCVCRQTLCLALCLSLSIIWMAAKAPKTGRRSKSKVAWHIADLRGCLVTSGGGGGCSVKEFSKHQGWAKRWGIVFLRVEPHLVSIMCQTVTFQPWRQPLLSYPETLRQLLDVLWSLLDFWHFFDCVPSRMINIYINMILRRTRKLQTTPKSVHLSRRL